jgi:hypothetical protein
MPKNEASASLAEKNYPQYKSATVPSRSFASKAQVKPNAFTTIWCIKKLLRLSAGVLHFHQKYFTKPPLLNYRAYTSYLPALH